MTLTNDLSSENYWHSIYLSRGERLDQFRLFYVFRVTTRAGQTDGRTDGRTTRNAAYRIIVLNIVMRRRVVLKKL